MNVLNVFCNSNVSHPSELFSDFLEAVICCFSLGKREQKYFEILEKHGEEKMKEFANVLGWVVNESEMGKDPLGEIYMELASRSKQKGLGQFFTPTHVCELMAKIVCPKTEFNKTFSDPACGSGRTFLAVGKDWSDYAKMTNRFVGVDLDPICLKMCVVNCFMHGLMGWFINGNSLAIEAYFGYSILPDASTGLPALKELSDSEMKKVLVLKGEKAQEVQLSMF